MEEQIYIPASRVGEPINYDVFLKHTMYPNGIKKEHDKSTQVEDLRKEVNNWRNETNTF